MEYIAALNAGILTVDIAPLYALLAATDRAISHRPAYPLVLASAQFVYALRHLGFQAELIPACTLMVHQDGKEKIDIGVWDHRPVMRTDGTTDGHVVVWTASFERLIDFGPCNHPRMIALSTPERSLTNPIVLPVVGGKEQLLDREKFSATLRSPFFISWNFASDWISSFDSYFICHAALVAEGGLALAEVALGLLSALAIYSDLSGFEHLFPQLAASVLSGDPTLGAKDSAS